MVLTGARQTGKTTLARRAPRRRFRSLDDPEVLDLAHRDPEVLLLEAPRMTLDEVQRCPPLLTAVKRAVDRDRSPGRFLLTGSANLLLMERVAESLAGRAVYLYLRPMTEPEKAGRPAAAPWRRLLAARSAREAAGAFDRSRTANWNWRQAVIEGGFPTPALQSDPDARRAWFDGYLRTYVERDLRQIAQIDALVDFRRLMKVAALRVGGMVNQAQLARDAGLSHATAHRYLNLLETSFLIARVPPYAVNRTKRLMKMPRLYWEDTALGAHLAGIDSPKDLDGHACAGGLLENLVWHHLRCWADSADEPVEILTWRTVAGAEVDFVLETRRRLLPVEVKASSHVGGGDLRHLQAFLDEYGDRAPFGLILYGGDECRLVAGRIVAVPLTAAVAV